MAASRSQNQMYAIIEGATLLVLLIEKPYEVKPLICPEGDGQMRIIRFARTLVSAFHEGFSIANVIRWLAFLTH
jgi:hypothetical protein